MAKIAFFCIPAYGHTNPTLGVVEELIRRGHEVRYYSYENFRKKIEETGAAFIPCDAYDRQQHLKKEDVERIGKDMAFSTELIVDMTLAMDDALLEDMKAYRPDVIVADSVAYWGKLIAKKLDIPFVSSTTTFAFNAHSAKDLQQNGPGFFSILKSMGKVKKSINRLKAKGYPVNDILDIVSNDNSTRTIVYTSPEFQPYAETFNENYAFVGPILRPAKEEVAASDKPLVYISLGTVNNAHANFYQNCLKAMENQPWQAVLSIGNVAEIKGNIPENCTIKSHVDQIALLQRADVFVTHCGMNSVSEGLAHGVPLVLFPQTPEQKTVADRAANMSAGIFLKDTSVHGIRSAVASAFQDAKLKEGAKQVQKSFERCMHAIGAADFIEASIEK